MKRLIALAALLCVSALAATVTNAPNWGVQWGYPFSNSNIVFRAYTNANVTQVTNLAALWTNWGTNAATGQLSNALYLPNVPSLFLTVAASNSLGGPESPPSVAVSVPSAQTPQSVGLNYIGP